MNNKKVMVFGTFDIIHEGHMDFFEKAKQCGDYLIVVVGRDKTVLKIKKKLPKNKQEIRVENLKKLKIIDKVVLGNVGDKYAIIQKYTPEIICIGYDQKSYNIGLRKNLIEKKLEKIKVIKFRKGYLPHIYKSSFIT